MSLLTAPRLCQLLDRLDALSGVDGPFRTKHYVFELYALSKMLDLPSDATRAQLLDAMKDIIVGKAAYVGRFRQ